MHLKLLVQFNTNLSKLYSNVDSQVVRHHYLPCVQIRHQVLASSHNFQAEILPGAPWNEVPLFRDETEVTTTFLQWDRCLHSLQQMEAAKRNVT
jgi:hypothetical protein